MNWREPPCLTFDFAGTGLAPTRGMRKARRLVTKPYIFLMDSAALRENVGKLREEITQIRLHDYFFSNQVNSGIFPSILSSQY